jgi:hypothetical protein
MPELDEKVYARKYSASAGEPVTISTGQINRDYTGVDDGISCVDAQCGE